MFKFRKAFFYAHTGVLLDTHVTEFNLLPSWVSNLLLKTNILKTLPVC